MNSTDSTNVSTFKHVVFGFVLATVVALSDYADLLDMPVGPFYAAPLLYWAWHIRGWILWASVFGALAVAFAIPILTDRDVSLRVPGAGIVVAATLLLRDRQRLNSKLQELHVIANQELKEQTQEHEQTESLHRAIVDSSTDCICRFKPDGTLTYVNDAYCELVGQDRSSLLGTNFQPLVPGEDQTAIDTMLKSLSANLEPYTHEHRVIMPNGQTHWLQWTNVPIKSTQGELIELQGIGRDIHLIKQAEEKLRESEAHYRALFENCGDAIFLLDETGKILDTNSAAVRMHGYTREEMLAMRIHDLDVPESATHVPQRMQRLQQGEYLTFEVRHRRKDGSEFPLEVLASGVEIGGEWYVIAFDRDITQRKAAEEQLRENRTLLQILVANAPAAVAMLDTQMRYLLWSDRWITDYRLPHQDLTMRSHYEVFPEIGDQWKAVHERCLRGATESCELDPFPRADGTLDYVRWLVQPWTKTNGETGGILLFTEVVTERQQTREALQQSEESLRSLIEVIPDMIFRVDADGILIDAKLPSLDDVLMPPEEFLGRHYRDVTPPHVSARFEQARHAASNTSTVQSFEYALDLPPGKQKTFEARAIGTQDGGCVLVVRNITLQKQAQQALANSEKRLRTVLQDIDHIAVHAFNDEGLLTFWNRGCERLYGYNADEAIGSCVDALFLNAKLAQSGDSLTHEVWPRLPGKGSVDCQILSKDGDMIDVLLSCIQLPELEEITETFCLGVDMTGRKRAEEELTRRRDELLHASRLSTIGQMVAAVSHEVAQPLSAIGNYAAASAKLVNDHSEAQEQKVLQYLAAIEKQNNRCGEILKRLRDFGRRNSSQYATCDLAELLDEAAELMHSTLTRKEVVLRKMYQGKQFKVDVDRIKIIQVVVNLLTNAFHAVLSLPKNRRVVSMDIRREEAEIVIDVADLGPGIDDAVRAKLFEPFVTTKPNGMGIGLSICQMIMQEHGGQIRVAPAIQGTTFQVLLPMQ